MERRVSADVLVVGGGVIGLAISYELARRGADVLVVERNELVGREASWASAGVMRQRVTTEDSYGWLARASRSRHATLAEELLAETGVDVGYRPCGCLDMALSEDRAASLHQFSEFHTSRGLRVELIDPSDVRQMEPHVTEQMCAAAFYPDDAQVRPPRLLRALAKACLAHGGRISAGTPAWELLWSAPGARARACTGVLTSSGAVHAGTTVLAAGCWSGLLAQSCGLFVPVRPVRGQMLMMTATRGTLSRVIHADDIYCVQREDGVMLVGATREEVGFNDATSVEGIDALRRGAAAAVPALTDSEVVRAWAGLRPAPAHRLPYIGQIADGLWVATGHHRTGILLAPATAQVVSEGVLTGRTPIPLDDFSPERDRARVQS